MASEEKDPSTQEKTGEKMYCENCKKEVFKTKIVMHITRNKGCKKHYGSKLDAIKEFQTAVGKKKSNKKYYENNSQKIKESYDPDERRGKYLKSKELDDKITERTYGYDSDDLAEDEEFKKLHERRESSRSSKAKWYQNKSEKIKENWAKSYNPEKRKARYQKKKEEIKRLFEKDSEESAVDNDVCRSLDKDEKEKVYKKELYNKNSKKTKKRKAEAHDPAKRKEQYQKSKRREEYDAAELKKGAEKYPSSSNRQLENESRNENETRRDEATISNFASCQEDRQKSPLSKIQKPYDFARGKINFSMEDLQNSSEGEDWDINCSLPISNSSPRIQPIRKSK